MNFLPSSFLLRGVVAAVILSGLAACGGGGDAADASDALAASHTSGEVTAAATLAVSDAGDVTLVTAAERESLAAVVAGTDCGLANFQAEALQRINAWRAQGASCGAYGTFAPTTALAWDDRLQSAAARHSKDMQSKNFFSHTGSDGTSAGTRITQAGYAWSAWGENIAAGQGTVQAVVDGWMASPGHCANIMKPTFRHTGLACVKGSSTNRYRTYWTMTLARPR